MPGAASIEELTPSVLEGRGMVVGIVLAAAMVDPKDGRQFTAVYWDTESSVPICQGLATMLDEDIKLTTRALIQQALTQAAEPDEEF